MSQPAGFRIETGARIHFGLLDVVRPFGGIGVMVDQPSTIVEIQRSDHFQIDDCVRSRGRAIVERICIHANVSFPPPLSIRVIEATPGHHGLGSGTQLSMAIAEGAARLLIADDVSRSQVICIADRGKRSAVGSHGYFQGGLLYDDVDGSGTTTLGHEPRENTINSICKRVELPSQWRLVLLIPCETEQVVFGQVERERFAALCSEKQATGRLRTLLRESVLPAAEAGDFQAFSEAIGIYNHGSGMLFADVQGGAYNGPAVKSMVGSLKQSGISGVGQSSWGPAVFAWCQSSNEAKCVAQQFASSGTRALVVKPLNSPRQLLVQSDAK